MLVVYNGPIDAVEVPAANCIAVRGEPVEVPAEVGASLIEQGTWDADAKVVLAIVGKDRDRAKRFLQFERDGAQRPEVLEKLEKIAEPPEKPQADAKPETQEGGER